MKIAIAYPPFTRDNALPLLTQNRQSKFSNSSEVRIYPLVMAYAATMLKNDGHEILWLDGINHRMGFADYEQKLAAFNPDWVILETKAPLASMHHDYIKKLAARGVKTVLLGDHMFYKTEENFERSTPDYVVVGGDYDFILHELFEFISGKRGEMPGGVYWREGNEIKNSGNAKFYDLAESPQIDRDLTEWQIYGEAYLHHPCAYILSGRGCGGKNPSEPCEGAHLEWRETKGSSLPGRCTFCIWQYSFWGVRARMRPVAHVVDELELLYKKYHVVEVFDDNETGPVWNKEWFRAFIDEMKRRGLLGKIEFSMNARGDNLDEETCKMCKEAKVRLLKVGVESGNNDTLKMIKKDETIEEIVEGVKRAKRYGMVALLTTMVGYPWETEEGARQTFKATKEIMLYRTKFGDSLQASVILPYPGTPLYLKALKENWFRVDPHDYDRFDQSEAVLKTEIDTTYWCRRMWRIMLNPAFIIKSFFTLRSWNDVKLAFMGFRSLTGHLNDYKHEAPKAAEKS